MINLIIKKTKQFETICFRLVFPFEEKEEDMAKICLLPSMLNYMSKKYPTEEEFKKAKLNNFFATTFNNSFIYRSPLCLMYQSSISLSLFLFLLEIVLLFISVALTKIFSPL